LRSVVAVDEQGQVVGHTGLTVRAPSGSGSIEHQARAAVAGNTVVDPALRGQGILGQMGAALRDLCISEGFIGYVHFPTTAHTIIQKRSVESGGSGNAGIETGLQLAYIPETTADYRGVQDLAATRRGRLAVTVVYQPFEEAPLRKVYLPERYAERLTELFEAAKLKRQRRHGRYNPAASSRLELDFDERRSLLHIQVEESGGDLGEQLDALLDSYPPGEAAPAIMHADLFLDNPDIGRAVKALSSRGFFYCGLLPEVAHTDVLRMQRLHSLPPGTDPFDVLLLNPGTQRLLLDIEKELAST
jgi:serine/threonine-protein kinase RsbW